jgi:hypothetical protein
MEFELECFTLDDSLRRNQMVEGYESFIWTERYQVSGDFQFVMKSTPQSRSLLAPGTWLGLNVSKYVMIVDTVKDEIDATDGSRNITVTGKSLENMFGDRVAMPAISDTTTNPNWVVTGTPGNVIRYMVDQICVVCILDEHDTIPFYRMGSLLPPGNISEPTDSVTITAQPDTLYNTITQIANTYGLGFRLIRNGDAGEIYFEVYMGNDLTSNQTILNPVIFDPNLDNLQGITQLSSSAQVKTVAYVYATNGSAVVYAVGADPNATGSDRRVLIVNSSNDADASDALTAALQQEGLMALAAQTLVYSFDGELTPSVPYTYGVDYNLGDLVEERNSDGYGNMVVVTEQIFSSDNTGQKSYPTLTLVQTITPGTWESWDSNQAWSDVDPSVEWGTV